MRVNLNRFHCCCFLLPFGIQQHIDQFQLLCFPGFIFHHHVYFNNPFIQTGFRCCVTYTPLVKMNFPGGYQVHVAVNTRTGIPARIGTMAVINFYSHNVLARPAYIRSDIVQKRNIPVWPFTNKLTVDIHLAAVINAFEIQIHILLRCYARQIEFFAVPSDSPGQISGTARQAWAQVPFNTPIVG